MATNLDEALNRITTLEAALGKLVTDLSEAHATERDAEHYGDDPNECTYCRDLEYANELLARKEKNDDPDSR